MYDRRMFPAIQVQISGLNRSAKYALALDFVPVNELRYRYHGSRWMIAGEVSAAVAGHGGDVTQRIYIHPDSPMTGQQWMSKSVSFIRLKLTNNLKDSRRYVSIDTELLSLQKLDSWLLITARRCLVATARLRLVSLCD